jgi:radical SAM superfamily enzyme YgiQ (UPF0313 family)
VTADRVCLIIPPSPFLLDERVFMSLGILKVAAALEQARVPVEVFDLSGVRNYEEAVAAHLGAGSVMTYGLTATSPQLPAAVKIADTIRSHETTLPRRRYRVILGGPHVTLVNAARKRFEKRAKGESCRATRAFAKLWEHFNVLVAGDGEEAILNALTGETPRFIDADGRDKAMFLDDKRLDASPFPARHLVDVASYRYKIDGVPALSLIAQLGCPFGCGFCAGRHSPMLRHIRMRSSDNIVAEMCQMWLAYGCDGFMFYDDELNVNRGLVELMEKIATVQAKNGVEWRLRGFIKAELFTDAQAAVMYRAGFRWILVGFESGSDRILDNINKRATRDDNTRCIEIARRHGLKVKALMSLGHPGESMATVHDTQRWLLDVRPDDIDVTVITPYPGSPYYDEAVPSNAISWTYTCRNGDRLYQDEVDYTRDADYYKGAPGDYVAHVWTDYLTREELVQARDRLEAQVREALALPFYQAAPALAYEHSMGQSLPPHLLRRSETTDERFQAD